MLGRSHSTRWRSVKKTTTSSSRSVFVRSSLPSPQRVPGLAGSPGAHRSETLSWSRPRHVAGYTESVSGSSESGAADAELKRWVNASSPFCE